MIYIFLLIMFCTTLPSIHYGDIVDEDVKYSSWKSIFRRQTIKMVLHSIHKKLYGAYFVKDRRLDRFISIITHLFSVWLVFRVFGFNAAILWGACSPCVYVSLWRNGRRYQLCNICALIVQGWQPYGIAAFLMTPLLQPALAPSVFLYLITQHWWFSLLLCVMFVPFFSYLKHGINTRLSKKCETLKTISPSKAIVALKTLAYYTYKFLIPQREFMYQIYLQSYGTTKTGNEKALNFDWAAFAGLVIFCCLVTCLFFDNTRVGAWWYMIFLLPYLNIITWHQHNNTRYAILPAIGLFALVGQFLPLWLCVGYAALHYYFFVMSMRMFIDQQTMFQHHFDDNPGAIAPYVSMGRHYLQYNQPKNALAVITVGLKRFPDSFGMWHLYCLCRPKDMRSAFEKLKAMAHEQTFVDQDTIKKMIKTLEIFVKQ